MTGAQGFVGRYLVGHLLDRSGQATVLGIGRSPRQDLHFLYSVSCGDRHVRAALPDWLHITDPSRYGYVSVDLSSGEIADVIRDFSPTAVIHLAASLRGVTDEVILQSNVKSTACLLDAVMASGIKLQMFLLASSGGVYGKQEKQPIKEDATVAPLNPYAQSKLASEDLAKDFALRSGTPTAIARIFNVLGPGQDELHVAGRIAGRVGTILAHNSSPVIQAGSLESSRDFLDVRDVCLALGTILDQNRQGVYNVGSGVETRIGDLLELFIQSAGLAGRIRIVADTTRTESIPRHVASIGLLEATGFAPGYSLARSCCEMLTYHQRFVHGHCIF